ncbi:DUF3108 domain-containing protein [Thermocrinis sp.]
MWFILLLLPISLLASELTLCYKAYFSFIPVARTCITYAQETDQLKVSSWVRTISVGGLVKRVYNHGYATVQIEGLKPLEFFYHQEEGGFKRRQHYLFKNSKIQVKETHYIELTDEVERVEERVYSYEGYPDPYTASLILYKNSSQNGSIKMFYDDKKYQIPYFVVGEEDMGSYHARVVEVKPNIKTKGLLKPRGNWRLWLDKEHLFPVKMQLLFVIGSVRAVLEEVRGDKELLRRVLSR